MATSLVRPSLGRDRDLCELRHRGVDFGIPHGLERLDLPPQQSDRQGLERSAAPYAWTKVAASMIRGRAFKKRVFGKPFDGFVLRETEVDTTGSVFISSASEFEILARK